MGLDQYLLAKVNNKEKLSQLKTEATGACGGLFPLTIKTHGKAEIGYWRKWYDFDDYMWGLLKNTPDYRKYITKQIAYYINIFSDMTNIEDTWYSSKEDIIKGIEKAGSVEAYATALVLSDCAHPNCVPIRISKKLVEEILSYAKKMVTYYNTDNGVLDAYAECRREWNAKANEDELKEYLYWIIQDWEGVVKKFSTALELINDYKATIYYEVWY